MIRARIFRTLLVTNRLGRAWFRILTGLLWLGLLGHEIGLWAHPPKITHLQNGLRLVVEHDPDAPLIALEVWVQAGVACETPENSGVAHLLEHMIFKGTPQHPPGTLDRVCEHAGGILSATTERDWTRFSVSVLPSHWQEVLRALLEHLRAPAIPPEELEKERTIILRDEYALHRSDPIRPVCYRLYEQAFPNHPYGLPLLGDPQRLRTLTREEVLAFHKRYYRPDHIVVVAVGNLQEPAVREVAGAVWGAVFSQEPTSPSPDPKPIRVANFREINGVLVRALPAPPGSAVDAMLAMEIVRFVLGEHYLGLLYSGDPPLPFGRLITEYFPRLQEGLLEFYFLPPVEPLQDWQARVEQRWNQAIEQIRKGRARPQIELAKTWLIQRHRLAMRTPLERARLYGLYTLLNLPHLPLEYEKRLRQITPEQVEALVEQLVNQEKEQPDSSVNRWAGLGSRAPAENPTNPTFPSKSEGERARPIDPNRIVRQRFANGLRAIALQQPECETVLIQVLIRTDVPENLPVGADELTARMLFTTTRNETLQTMGYRIAMSGGNLSVFWEPNTTRIVAYMRPNAFGNLLSTLAEGLLRTEFETEHFQRAVRQALWERRWTEGTQEWRLFAKLGSLYADESALQKVSIEHVRRFYRSVYRPQRTVIVVVGPHPPERMLTQIGRYFGSEWHDPSRPPASPVREPTPKQLRTGNCVAPGTTHYIGYHYTLPASDGSHYLHALLLQTILTEGKGARLFQAYREQLGRGYGVRGQIAFTEQGVILTGFVQFGNLDTGSRRAYTESLASLCKASPTPEETQRARALLIGNWHRDRYNSEEWSRRIGLAELFGWGYEAETQQ